MDTSNFRQSDNIEDLRDSSLLEWGARQVTSPFKEAYEALKHPFTGPETIPPDAYTNPMSRDAGFYSIDKLIPPPAPPLDDKTALMIKALQQGF